MAAKFPAIPVEQGHFLDCSHKCRLITENVQLNQDLARSPWRGKREFVRVWQGTKRAEQGTM
jgi:hypothetical protein